MQKKLICIAGICLALSTAVSGCSSDKRDTDAIETDTNDTDVNDIENVTDVDAQSSSLCVYGPVSEITSDSITIDNQSGFSSQGDMVITFTAETPIFDAVTGNPVDMTEAETGTVVYAYIGEAMTMSEPPITNGELFFVNTDNADKIPVYTEIQSVNKSKDNEENVVVKTENGAEYIVSDETRILPYLTRNIVTVEDLESGKKCVIWANAEGKVSKMVLFQ